MKNKGFMWGLLVVIMAIGGCVSKVELREREGYAYIVTKLFEKTNSCSGSGYEIVGVRQRGRVPEHIKTRSLYVPKGENFVYYVEIFESMTRGGCIVIEEVVVRHTEVRLSAIEKRPAGVELKVEVESGKKYVLEEFQGKVQLREFEY